MNNAITDTLPPSMAPMWWFPVLPDDPSKRLALGVPLEDGATQPDIMEYPDLLAIRIQDLIDRAGKRRAREAIEDLLTSAENVLTTDDPDAWGEMIVETDQVQALIADATDELLEPPAPLDPETLAELTRAAGRAKLREILALI